LFARDPNQLPKYSPEFNCTKVDLLDELLLYISKSSPDCLSHDTGQDLNLPVPTLPSFIERVEAARQALLKQAQADQQLLDTKTSNKPTYDHWMVKPPETPQPLSSYHQCRILLSQLGLLLFERRAYFSELENSTKFHRSLGQLDKTLGREMLKIGVIYVKEGQEDQKVILSNDSKSPTYREFVRGLGWTVDVTQHRGYLGGLDPKMTTGSHTPYFANSVMEIIFHEVTAIPTNPTDPQQIVKKRHIGNDIVNVVYSEHCRDYSPDTISTQFNDAQIIVYPINNGLFRIQVYKKDTTQLFGPLVHGMCVEKKVLAPLVRLTAIQANRAVRFNTEGYSRPYPTRKRAIAEIVQRYKVPKNYEDVMTEMIQPTIKALNTDTSAGAAGAAGAAPPATGGGPGATSTDK
jgi:hypothetical protein